MARRLSGEERALWTRLTDTIRPIAPRREPPTYGTPPAIRAPAKAGAQGGGVPPPIGVKAATPRKPVASPANTLDGGWDRRLVRGTVMPSMSVDLHGHTLAGAHAALDAALDRAVRDGDRVMLLVTGKPRRDGSGRGAIAEAVPHWLAASHHAGSIAAVRRAHPRHGGAGALYIVMRRVREGR